MPIVTATITSDGTKLPDKYELLSIETIREVNRIPTAELVLLDGDPTTQRFTLSDEDLFLPGKEIEVKLRYEGGKGGDQTVFKGLVYKHTIEASEVASTLTVELKDKAVGMIKARKSAVFTQQSDADIIKALIAAGGAEAGAIPTTQPTYPETVQFQCTDWDYMLSRAEINNLLVIAEDGKVSLKKLEISGSPVQTYTYGVSEMYGFEMAVDAGHQYESIESIAWDIKTQKLTQASTAAPFSLSQGDQKGAAVAEKFGGKKMSLTNAVPLDPAEVKSWADGRMAQTSMSLLRGVITVAGTADIKLMDIIKIEKIGKRFDGTTLVTGIRHTVTVDGWRTDLQFGLPGKPFSQTPDIVPPPASGMLPGVNGLQIGVIDAFEDDPDQEFRVRVLLPGLDPDNGKVWARLVSPEAGLGADGKGRGYFFRPEQGDEVVVGFLNDDPRQALVLGSLYSSKNVPPAGWDQLDAENALKGIASKSGIKIEIDDTNQTLKLQTSENQSVLMDEKNKQILITDVNQNTITLDNSGVTLQVAGKLTVNADGDIDLNGSNININASSNVAIAGSAVDIK